MIEKLEIRAENQPWRKGVSLMVFDGDAIGEPIIMKTLTENEKHEYREPTLTISNHSAQLLMDDLWKCGLRPSEGTGSAGSLRATEKHLEDMRTIVSKTLEVNL